MPLTSVLGAQSLVRPGVCTSSTRPASPFDGQVIYETDTNVAAIYDGSSWVTIADTDFTPFGAWTAYTPSLTASTTNPNIGSTGNIGGRYIQIGKTVIGQAKVVFGGTGVSAGSGVYYISLPVTALNAGQVEGQFFAQDESAAARQIGSAWSDTTTKLAFFYDGASGYPAVAASAPWTWAANDILACKFVYEAA